MSTTPPPAPQPVSMGNWRLVNPPANVTAASNAITSACAGWKPVFVEAPAVATATPEEGVCLAVQDWSSWGMQRSAEDHITGFVAGVPTGVLFCVGAIFAWRGLAALGRMVVPPIGDHLEWLVWRTRRALGR